MQTQSRPAQDLRGLKALVGFLGVLVILGTALVIGIIIHRLYGKAPAAAPATVPSMTLALPQASNVLAAGEHISGMAGAGGKIAIWVSGPDGEKILVLDPDDGKLTLAVSSAR